MAKVLECGQEQSQLMKKLHSAVIEFTSLHGGPARIKRNKTEEDIIGDENKEKNVLSQTSESLPTTTEKVPLSVSQKQSWSSIIKDKPMYNGNLSDVSVHEILVIYNEYNLGSHHDNFTKDADRGNKSKIHQVVKYCYSIAAPEQLQKLKAKAPDSLQQPILHLQWKQDLQVASSHTERLLMTTLATLESQLPAPLEDQQAKSTHKRKRKEQEKLPKVYGVQSRIATLIKGRLIAL